MLGDDRKIGSCQHPAIEAAERRRNSERFDQPGGGRLLIIEDTIPFARRSATAAWVRAVDILVIGNHSTVEI